MNLSNEQIEKEFERQVRLCSGIGLEKMLTVVEKQFNAPKHHWQFYMNGTFCTKCGRSIADAKSECK